MHYCIAVLSEKESDVKKLLAPYIENPENENGKWDWYEIGGRFDDVLINKNTHRKCSSAKVKDIDIKNLYTYGILTPDGVWIDKEDSDTYKEWVKSFFGKCRVEELRKMQEEFEEEWREKSKEILENADPEWNITIVDIHM